MTSFRFIHAADIHLDSPLKGLAGQEGAAAERIRAAPREAFEQLVGAAIDEDMGDEVRITVVATGFSAVRQSVGSLMDAVEEPPRRLADLPASEPEPLTEADLPTFLRRTFPQR